MSFKGIIRTYLLKISITHNKNAGNNLQPVIKYIVTTTFLTKFFSFPLINVYGSEHYKMLEQLSSRLRSLITCSQSNIFVFLVTKTSSDQFWIFLFWDSYMVTNFNFRIFNIFVYIKVKLYAWIYMNRLHFNGSMISLLYLLTKSSIKFINTHFFWYWSHIFVNFVL